MVWLRESGKAGGIDYFSLPEATKAGLFVALNDSASNIAQARTYISERGWGTNGSAVGGTSLRDRAYSKDGYGVIRSKVGEWA